MTLDKLSNFSVSPLKRMAVQVVRKADPSDRNRPYTGLEHIESGTGRRKADGEETDPEAANLFEPGDVLFGKLRPYLAKVYLSDHQGRCTSEALVLRPRPNEMSGRYLRHLLLSQPFLNLVDSSTYGAKMPRANWDFIGNAKIPTPPISAQRLIADFLDQKTEAIDGLIAKKERFIELLQEKRQALITQAVTKGLDPNIPMKDSGIEWLGKIPAHWEVSSLGKGGRFVAGTGFPHSYQGIEGEEFPFFKVGDMARPMNLENLRFSPNSVSRVSAMELGARICPPGSIAFAKVGAALLLNRRRVIEIPSIIDNNMMSYVPRKDETSYIRLWLEQLDFGRLANPGPVPSVSESALRPLPLLRPPAVEQVMIAERVRARAGHIDEQIDRSSQIVERLREYRQALITAAVTGQLEIAENISKEAVA